MIAIIFLSSLLVIAIVAIIVMLRENWHMKDRLHDAIDQKLHAQENQYRTYDQLEQYRHRLSRAESELRMQRVSPSEKWSQRMWQLVTELKMRQKGGVYDFDVVEDAKDLVKKCIAADREVRQEMMTRPPRPAAPPREEN